MRKKKMAMFLMAVMVVAMLLSGCGKKPLIVEESKEGSTEVTVELPTITKEPENPSKEMDGTGESKEADEGVKPTKAPVLGPTPEPTDEPEVTKEPVVTEAPTEAPTQAPTEAPTATPKPTEKPTTKPTAAPTATPKPTKAPEVKPTEAPKPTATPVATPAPTAAPTPAPTAAPTNAPAHTHSYDDGTVTTKATCGKEGVKTFKCACGETKTESIPATGNHQNTYDDYMYQPSCTRGGYKNTYCSDCGSWVSGGDIGMTPHDYEKTLVYEGDCCNPAAYSQKCKVCDREGPTEYGDLNPNVHNWETLTDKLWDDEKNYWYDASETYCSWCGESKGIVRLN